MLEGKGESGVLTLPDGGACVFGLGVFLYKVYNKIIMLPYGVFLQNTRLECVSSMLLGFPQVERLYCLLNL